MPVPYSVFRIRTIGLLGYRRRLQLDSEIYLSTVEPNLSRASLIAKGIYLILQVSQEVAVLITQHSIKSINCKPIK